MVYDIIEISRVRGTPFIYVLVHYWQSDRDRRRGQEPYLVNDFILQIPRTQTRVVTDANGWMKTTSGEFIDPNTLTAEQDRRTEWEKETVNVDVRAVITQHINNFWQRSQARLQRGILTSRVERDTRDDDGILAETGDMVTRSR